jgi:hypothetical protein
MKEDDVENGVANREGEEGDEAFIRVRGEEKRLNIQIIKMNPLQKEIYDLFMSDYNSKKKEY